MLYQDNTLLMQTGKTTTVSGEFSFQEILAQGEHMSARYTDSDTDAAIIFDIDYEKKLLQELMNLSARELRKRLIICRNS